MNPAAVPELAGAPPSGRGGLVSRLLLPAFLAIIVVCIWQMERLEDRCEADIAAERLAEAAPLAGAADSPEAM